MNPEREIAESVAVWDMNDLYKAPNVINVAKDSGLPESKAIRRAVQPEYNADWRRSVDLPVGRQDRPVRHRRL